MIELRGRLFGSGLAWPSFPTGMGGRALSAKASEITRKCLQEHGVPDPDFSANPIGLGMAAPVLAQFGTVSQHAPQLRRIYTGEDVWYQLFSEPTAGSDLAGVSTRAVRDGETWVLNGQKVWTTLAHMAR